MIFMTFLGGVLGPFLQEKEQEAGPKHPLKKSYTIHPEIFTN